MFLGCLTLILLNTCLSAAGQEVTVGNWTWIKGSDKTNQAGVYGTISEPSFGTTPGSRLYHSMTIHQSQRFILVFGGNGVDADGTTGNIELAF